MERIQEGYVRVSDVLQVLQKYAYIPRERLKKSQEVGTEVHAAIEAYYLGKDLKILDSKKFPYFQSFLLWQEAFKPKPIIVEERYYDHELMVTGRVDLIAEVNGEKALVDFKTGSVAHPEIWKLQGTFYRKMAPLSPDVYYFVQLNRDGSAPIIHRFEYKKEWDLVLPALVSVYKFCVNEITLHREVELNNGSV